MRPHHVADLLLEDRARGGLVATRPRSTPTYARSSLRWNTSEGGASAWAPAARASSAAAACGVGQHADGARSAYVEGVGTRRPSASSASASRAGDLGQRLAEVVEVLPVGADRHLADAGLVQRLLVERDVARVEGLELGQLALLGVEPHHRLVDQAVEDHRTDLLRDRRHRLVDVGDDIVGLATDRLRDPPRPPHRQPRGPAPAPTRLATDGGATRVSRIIASPDAVLTPSAAANARARVPRHRRHARVGLVGVAVLVARSAQVRAPRRGPGERPPTPPQEASGPSRAPAPRPTCRAPARSGRWEW